MAVYFAGQGAGQMFSFAGSKYQTLKCSLAEADGNALTIVMTGFTKASSAANYYFWLCNLVPTIQDTTENRQVAPANGCKSYDFSNVAFAYPLAPNNRVLKGISLNVRFHEARAFNKLLTIERIDPTREICRIRWRIG